MNNSIFSHSNLVVACVKRERDEGGEGERGGGLRRVRGWENGGGERRVREKGER